jgi:hypothetical protein
MTGGSLVEGCPAKFGESDLYRPQPASFRMRRPQRRAEATDIHG